MKIIAAGNLQHENPNLTTMPEPLLNRFLIHEVLQPEAAPYLDYLNTKYGLQLHQLSPDVSPRSTEQAILAYRAGLEEIALKKGGGALLAQLKAPTSDMEMGDIDELYASIVG